MSLGLEESYQVPRRLGLELEAGDSQSLRLSQ